MKRIGIVALAVVFVSVLCSGAFCVEKGERLLSFGGGAIAGMSGIKGDMAFRLPSDMYFRIGLGLTDSKNLPSQDWRRFAPLCLDGIYYFAGNVYAGAGLNYPLKVSDDERGDLGTEYFLGADYGLGSSGNIYAELGYSVIRRVDCDAIAGLQFIFGWSYGLSPVRVPEKTGAVETQAPMVASLTTAPPEVETALIEARKQELGKTRAEMSATEAEVRKVGGYVDLLSGKIKSARDSGNSIKVAELKMMKGGALGRASALKEKMASMTVKCSELEAMAGGVK